MSLKQAFILALKSLSGSKLRAFLTMLGIIIGVAAVIVIVSVVNSMTSDIVAQFEQMGATTINVSVMGRGGNRSVSIEDMQNKTKVSKAIIEKSTLPSVANEPILTS